MADLAATAPTACDRRLRPLRHTSSFVCPGALASGVASTYALFGLGQLPSPTVLLVLAATVVGLALLGSLLVKVVRGDFWPPRLLGAYRDGYESAREEPDEG